ncbi:MAG: hypothetical protein EHM53_07600 [Methanoregulaceae archaeon]|nr:MAG: hypothetical protein EHM53_07600 [Methanoregulaceae archaeon]
MTITSGGSTGERPKALRTRIERFLFLFIPTKSFWTSFSVRVPALFQGSCRLTKVEAVRSWTYSPISTLLLNYQKFCLNGSGTAQRYEQTIRGSSLNR